MTEISKQIIDNDCPYHVRLHPDEKCTCPCPIPLGGPSAMHSEMAENGDLEEHIARRHKERL